MPCAGTSDDNPDVAEDFTHLHLVAENVRTAAAGFDHIVFVTKTSMVSHVDDKSSCCFVVGPRYCTDPAHPTPLPVLIKPASTIVSVAAGEHHTLLLSDTGEIFAFGSNTNGQLGVPAVNHSFTASTEPVLISGIAGTAIAAGARHSVCIDHQGRCYAWGSSLHGQCGTETGANQSSVAQPTLVEALGPLVCSSVAAGMRHTLCCTSTGDVYGWGSNENGELACSESDTAYIVQPRLIDDPALENERIIRVSACGRHSLALSDNGRVFSWGFGAFGQLGLGNVEASSSSTCTEVEFRVEDAVAGWWHSLFLPLNNK